MDVFGLSGPERCRVMGILNVTTDSFSDGGRYVEIAHAIKRGYELAADGADIVDVGGESTRPGAVRTKADDELARVIPVVRQLASSGICVSVDTMRSTVATAAVEAGAQIINDVSGGLADPAMAGVIAQADVPYVLMHWHDDVALAHAPAAKVGSITDRVVAQFIRRLDALIEAGVDPGRIILDPGLGFAKTADDNWQLLSRMEELRRLGYPTLIGASRKAFLGKLLDAGEGPPPPHARDDATAAITALAAAAGAACVRVHDVRPSRAAVAVARRWNTG